MDLHIMVSFKRSLLRLALDFSLPDVSGRCSLLLVLLQDRRVAKVAAVAPLTVMSSGQWLPVFVFCRVLSSL
jgi:hypothetical protein